MRRWIFSTGLGLWVFASFMPGFVWAQGLADNRWIDDEVLPKLEAMKTKAVKDLGAAEEKIKERPENDPKGGGP